MQKIEKIKTFGLSKDYPGEQKIQYKDMIFIKGKPCMIIGASGCGKSTLLNMIAGLCKPTTGKVLFGPDSVLAFSPLWMWERPANLFEMTPRCRDRFRIKNIGYIYQDFKLIEDMSVKDNIEILGIEGVDISGSDEILKKLGIYEYRKKKVKYLSGGQKQRVGIARALVKNPPIVLADEPTGNLNYEIGEKIVSDLVEYAKDKILIVVTHDTRLAKYFDIVIDINDDVLCEKGE